MTPEEQQAQQQAQKDALRAKYAQSGTLISGSTFAEEDHPPTFSISLEGLEGTGKTHFVILTMPLPMVIVNFGDRNPIPFLYQMPEERRKQITIYNIQPPSEQGWDFANAVGSLKELGEIVRVEGPGMTGGTFAFDGGSSWWSVMQQVFVEPKEKAAEAAGKKKAGGLIYEEANNRARGVMGYIKTLGCYFVMTHQLKQDWASDGPIPNQFSPRRNSQVPYLMEVVVRMMKVCSSCKAPNCQNKDHVGRLHMSRLEKLSGNTGLEGMWVENLDFPMLYSFQNGQQYSPVTGGSA